MKHSLGEVACPQAETLVGGRVLSWLGEAREVTGGSLPPGGVSQWRHHCKAIPGVTFHMWCVLPQVDIYVQKTPKHRSTTYKSHLEMKH